MSWQSELRDSFVHFESTAEKYQEEIESVLYFLDSLANPPRRKEEDSVIGVVTKWVEPHEFVYTQGVFINPFKTEVPDEIKDIFTIAIMANSRWKFFDIEPNHDRLLKAASKLNEASLEMIPALPSVEIYAKALNTAMQDNNLAESKKAHGELKQAINDSFLAAIPLEIESFTKSAAKH